MPRSEEDLIADILKDKRSEGQALRYIYVELGFFKECLNYVRRKGGTKEDAEEVGMDALLALRKAIRKGSFVATKGSLYYYFMGTVKNRWNDKWKRHYKLDIKTLIEDFDLTDEARSFVNNLDEDVIRTKIIDVLNGLGDTCKKLIIYGYRGINNKEIAEMLGSDWDARKVSYRRNKCKEKLRVKYQDQLNYLKEISKSLSNGL